MLDLLHMVMYVLALVVLALPFSIVGVIVLYVYDRIAENRQKRDRSPPESDI